MENQMQIDLDPLQNEFFPLMDLFDREADIVDIIFNQLNLRDRLSLALCCKNLEQFHSSRPKFWQNVWLNVDQAEPTLLRKYENIKYDFDIEFSQPPPRKVLTPHAQSMKALQMNDLQILSDESDEQRVRATPFRLILMLPLLENLVHLDLLSKTPIDYRSRKPSIRYDFDATTVVTMVHLQSLKINFGLFSALSRRYVNFLSCYRLKTLHVTEDRIGFIDYLEDPSIGIVAFETLSTLIGQQRDLKTLKLKFSNCTRLFDEPLVTESQLHEFKIRDLQDVNENNLIDFLEGQTELSHPKLDIWMWGRDEISSSTRIRQYVAKILDLPLKVQAICTQEEDIVSVFSTVVCYFTREELCRIFRSQPVIQNEVTEKLTFELLSDVHRRRSNDWLISGVCFKYMNLAHVSISSHGSLMMPDLSPLNTLRNLKSLKVLTDRIGSSLRDVNIPDLQKFLFTVYGFSIMKHRDFVQLKKFLIRHGKLPHLTIIASPFYEGDMNPYAVKTFKSDSYNLLPFAIENMKKLETMKFYGVDLSNEAAQYEIQRMVENYPNPDFKLKSKDLNLKVEMSFVKTADGVEITSVECDGWHDVTL